MSGWIDIMQLSKEDIEKKINYVHSFDNKEEDEEFVISSLKSGY